MFAEKVRSRLAAFPEIAIIGVVGAIGVTGLAWWKGTQVGRVMETRGALNFTAGCVEADSVDGLLMVLSPWAVHNLRFDERYSGFHAYDVDICFQARDAGKKVAVDDLRVMHHTKGGFGDHDQWDANDAAFKAKWGLPADPG
jgi:GT2 family glycosyltransferase